jgi:glycosyltransferase involved in cell wall biosynthesis
MKIIHINTSDKLGGAAIAAFRLHNTMLNEGIESKYLVLNKTIHDRNDIISLPGYKKYIKNILNKTSEKMTVRRMRGRSGLFSSFKYGIDISKCPELTDSDVIYIHWICGSFINFRILKKLLQTGTPVFWFMHDMFPITGGCHYSFECTKYYAQCDTCFYYMKHGILPDLSMRQYKIKRRIYQQSNNLFFIAPSRWLADCARKSALTQDKPIYHIPNLIDPRLFKPMPKDTARRLFSIENNKKVIGFGADSALTNPYKGWSYLKDALNMLSYDTSVANMEIEIVIFGSNLNEKIASSIPFVTHFYGHLQDEYSLVMVYNCMDIFVIPSLAESFGQTALESLAANVPVVGFNVGGIPDIVNEHTGYLAEYKNSADLAKGIASLLQIGKKDVSVHVSSFYADAIVDHHKNFCKSIGFPPPPPPPVGNM